VKKTIIRDLANADAVAESAAHDLANQLTSLLATQHEVCLVLTGGTVGIKTLACLAPLIKDLELSRLSIWWGDERFVESESADRNFVQAREVLLSKLQIPTQNIHPMPSTEAGELAGASLAFAESLGSDTPTFDIVLLGVGDDGHIASLFPGSKPIEFGKWVIAEPNSPKAPAQRISFSYEALSSANQVWFLVAGEEKAEAVSRVFAGEQLPAGKVSGKNLTKWYLDKAAASRIIS
jgi:6-phosphogluconolactonase